MILVEEYSTRAKKIITLRKKTIVEYREMHENEKRKREGEKPSNFKEVSLMAITPS